MAARLCSSLRNLPRQEFACGSFRRCLRVNQHLSRRLTIFPQPAVRIPPTMMKISSTINSTSLVKHRQPFWHHLAVFRAYSSSSGADEGGEEDGDEKKSEDEQDSDGEEGLSLLAPIVKQYAVAPVTIPDKFPEVPVLPITRNPIFPRFVKMLEVCRFVKACS